MAADDAPSDATDEQRVLVLAPTARDAEVTRALLAGEGLTPWICDDTKAAAAALASPPAAAGAGVLLTTEEVIIADGIDELLAALRGQPAWSQLPVVLLMRGGVASPAAARVLRALANVTLLDRPASMRTVASAVQSALRERRRQYQIRDQMQEIQRLLARAEAARAEAVQAARLKDEFLATVSHELRTPLSAILLWARMIEEGRVDSDELPDAYGAIVRSAEAQRQLVDDLLDMARMMTGKLRLEVRDADLADVLRAAGDAVRPAAEAKGVTLDVVGAERGGAHDRVRADPGRLQQVVWNLMSNAVKFTPEGGRVEARIVPQPAAVLIVVTDTGRGIDPRFLPHVFDRFRQADASITRAYGGLGLGLAIARELVEMHGGTIRAESAGEGRGATFIVELPASREQQQHRLPDVPAAPARPRPRTGQDTMAATDGRRLSGVNVLLVEDEPHTRKALHRLLERAGAHVDAVDSAAAALDRLRHEAPDVLVSDIGLPIEDGYSLLRKAIRLSDDLGRSPVPAMALTAYARGEDREQALAAGYHAYLRKPVEPGALVTAIADLTGRNRRSEPAT